MERKKCKFSYNDWDDSLLISCRRDHENVRERFGMGDFIFNLTRQGKIVGLNIRNASKVFSDYNLGTGFLKKLDKVELMVAKKENLLLIALILNSENQKGKIPIPLMNLNNKTR